MARRLLVRIVVLSIAIGAAVGGPARGETISEYEVKAEFLERFTRFIDWPGSDSGPFTIGVIGRSPFGKYLDHIAATRKIKGRTVEVRYLTDPADVESCQLLFICASEKDHLREILSRTESRPILTVGETTGFAAQGVLINFFTAADTVRFEINEGAVGKSGLKISSKLLKLARLVDTEGR